jgi:hypothetical protein
MMAKAQKSASRAKPKESSAKREARLRSKRIASGKAQTIHKTNRRAGERLAKGMPYRLKPLQSMEVRQPNQDEMLRKGMSLRQLVRATPRYFINSAVDVHLRKVQTKKTATGRPVLYGQAVTADHYRADRVRRIHEVYIVGMDDDDTKPVTRHKHVLIQCSCERYVYYFEYANAVHGAARLIYSNGNAPVVTNPGLAPGCCKHLIALAKYGIEEEV